MLLDWLSYFRDTVENFLANSSLAWIRTCFSSAFLSFVGKVNALFSENEKLNFSTSHEMNFNGWFKSSNLNAVSLIKLNQTLILRRRAWMFSFLLSKSTQLRRAIVNDNVAQTIEILKQQNSLLNEYCVQTFPSLFFLRVSDRRSNSDCSYINYYMAIFESHPLWQEVGTFHQIIYWYLFEKSTHSITGCKRIWDFLFIFI